MDTSLNQKHDSCLRIKDKERTAITAETVKRHRESVEILFNVSPLLVFSSSLIRLVDYENVMNRETGKVYRFEEENNFQIAATYNQGQTLQVKVKYVL